MVTTSKRTSNTVRVGYRFRIDRIMSNVERDFGGVEGLTIFDSVELVVVLDGDVGLVRELTGRASKLVESNNASSVVTMGISGL